MARIRTRQLTSMCHRLGIALQAGVDVRDALQRESTYGGSSHQYYLAQVAAGVNRGMTMAEAMRRCGAFFPPLTVELVDIGEQTGNLDSVLLRLAEHYQQLMSFRSRFLLGIAWPLLQLVAAVVVIGLLILMLGLLGASSGIFGLAGPRGLAVYSAIVASVTMVLLVIGFGLSRGWFGRAPGELLMRLPVVGRTIRTMALARLAWTLGLALNAGMDACRAIRLALLSTQHRYFIRHTPDVEATIVRGGQFHEALRKTRTMPEEFLQALENAEVTGTETESLRHLSQDYAQRALAAATTLGYLATLATWGMIAALLIAVFFHLFFSLYLKPINEALDMRI